MPRGYRVLEFTLFSRENDQSTVEQIDQFRMQCGETSSNDLLKLRLFGNSLTGTTFVWYKNLSVDSIHSWQDMEEKFQSQFFWTEPEVSMEDLSRLRQLARELVERYLSHFKRVRNRCCVALPEIEFVKLAMNG